MDELIDILDSDGNHIGKTAMKSEAHKYGWFHKTVHVWFYTADGKVLLQKRGRNKKTFPLLWDASVAGHIAAGEEIKIAAKREVKEEIGIDVNPTSLQKIGVFKSVQKHNPNFIDSEFHHTFICELKHHFTSLKKQETEVEELKVVSIDQFENDFQDTDLAKNFVPHSLAYYKTIITAFNKARLL